MCQGSIGCLESFYSPLFSAKQAQTFQSSDALEPQPDRASPSPYSTERSHRQAEGGDRPARARSATLQGSHSIATAELLAPPQDTVRRMLKRGPQGRSGQPWRSSREQRGGGKAPGMGEEGLVFSPEPFLLDPSIPNLENLPTQGEGSARPILNPTSLQPPLLCLTPFCFHSMALELL